MKRMMSSRTDVWLRIRGYLEEGDALQDAGGAAHLPDGVHGELGSTDVHHSNAEFGGQDGADGGPTGAVVTDHHILEGRGHYHRLIQFGLTVYFC